MRLNQLLAIEKTARDNGQTALTQAYHDGQRATQLDGFTKQYTPDNEDGERFPEESKVLQLRMRQVLKSSRAAVAEMFQITAQRDHANCSAKADIEVDGTVLVEGVPSTYLLWLEKKLVDLHTFISKLPSLPPGDTWRWDDNTDCYVSDPVNTAKTKKIPKVLIKYEATKEHPAQTEVYHEDVKVGQWRNVKYSGALPRTEIQDMLERLDKLTRAVKMAREKANSVEVPKVAPYGDKILGFIFG